MKPNMIITYELILSKLKVDLARLQNVFSYYDILFRIHFKILTTGSLFILQIENKLFPRKNGISKPIEK